MENRKIKKVIFLGRKNRAVEAIKYLIDKDIDIAAIVGVEIDSHRDAPCAARDDGVDIGHPRAVAVVINGG